MTTMDGRTARAEEKRHNRRKAILGSARRVFGERGYHRTHVADIIEAAGIARGTFYLYFESKGAIFVELLDDLLNELRGSIVGVETGSDSPPVEQQLVGTVRRILGKVVDNRLLTTIIIREAVGLDEDVDQRLNAFYRDLLEYIRDSLDEGQRMGILRAIDTQVAAFCVLGTIKQLMEQLVMEDEELAPVDIDRLALTVLDFNLRGLLKA